MTQYQALIIGFGKAGKTLAATLAKTGWRVAIIEQSASMFGGTCINIGCIPTKTLVHDAEREGDFSVAMQRKAAVVNFLRDKNFHNLADLDNVDVIEEGRSLLITIPYGYFRRTASGCYGEKRSLLILAQSR